MQELLDRIQELKTNGTKNLIDIRLTEFKEIKNQPITSIFKELCFCIMTANCSAKKCIEIQRIIDEGFLTLGEEELARTLKRNKYRFPNVRSKYIIEAREKKDQLAKKLKSTNKGSLREWIVKNIRGIGFKEASHFLRNIGYDDYAIIDFHIIDLLVKHSLIQRPKYLTKNRYLEIETVLKNIGQIASLNLAELDLYLWYLETGEILK